MKIEHKEKMDIARVIVSLILLVTAIYGMINHSIGWGWFLMGGVLIYPTHINIDFRPHKE